MIKIALKHVIYEYAINTVFDRVSINFGNHSITKYKVGDYIPMLKLITYCPNVINSVFKRQYTPIHSAIFQFNHARVIHTSDNYITLDAYKYFIDAINKKFQIVDVMAIVNVTKHITLPVDKFKIHYD